jgi:hypothetical protein
MMKLKKIFEVWKGAVLLTLSTTSPVKVGTWTRPPNTACEHSQFNKLLSSTIALKKYPWNCRENQKDANHDCVLHYCIIFVRMGIVAYESKPNWFYPQCTSFASGSYSLLEIFCFVRVILTSGVEHSQMQGQVAFTCEILMGTSTWTSAPSLRKIQ